MSQNIPIVYSQLGNEAGVIGASATDTGLGQYGRISAIPDGTGYIMTGTNTSGLILDNDFNFVYEMPRELPIQGRAQDMNLFEFNGVRYLSYTVNREWTANDAFIEIVALTDGGEDFAVKLTDDIVKANARFGK